MPAKYSAAPPLSRSDSAFVDEYDLRGGVAAIALIQFLAGLALVFFGIREGNVYELALGVFLVLVAVIGGVASEGFIDKPRGRHRAILATLPVLALWLFGVAVLLFLGYAFFAAFSMLKWLLLPIAVVVAASVVVSSRLRILDHMSLPSHGMPFGQHHPVNQGVPLPVDPNRHRESDTRRDRH